MTGDDLLPSAPPSGELGPPGVSRETRDAAEAFIRAARAPNTRAAYAGDLKRFGKWCAKGGHAPPFQGATIAFYLTDLAREGRKLATIKRALASISQAHELAGQENPCRAKVVREFVKGFRRESSAAQKKAAPLLRVQLEKLIRDATLRDQALLLLGWACALRRSEVVALRVGDLRVEADEGLVVSVSGKTEKGERRDLGVVASRTVDVVREWLIALRDGLEGLPPAEAWLFPGRKGGTHLSGRYVAELIKRRCKLAGLDPAIFSGHSLRSGFSTQAARDGKDLAAIMSQTRHRDPGVAMGYIRRGRVIQDSPTKGTVL